MNSKNFKLITNLLLCFFLSSCVTSAAQSEPSSNTDAVQPTLEGTDLYGSSHLTLEMVKKSHGELLQKCIDEFLAGNMEDYQRDKKIFSESLTKDYNLAFASLTIIQYYNLYDIPGRQAYATIDVVEKADTTQRMSFLSRPHGHYPDPDGLLKAWEEYQQIGFELLRSGEISGMRVDCPAFHCIFGHEHPRLAPFKDVFVQGVAKHKRELMQIFANEERDQARASAAFLLAYVRDGRELVQILSRRMNDGAEDVRNNVLRVLSDIAQFHRDLILPIEKVIPMLDYPETTDRNKASAVIWGVISDSAQLQRYRMLIMQKAVPILLRTLRLQQPNNHDFAYLILRSLSDKDYGERNYAAWENWYQGEQR